MTTTNRREVNESPLEQGADERVAYSLTTTPWGASPSAVVVTLWEEQGRTWTDVSSTKLSGSPSVTGDVIMSPMVQSLTPGNRYRLECTFTAGGQTWEPYLIIEARR